MRYFFFLALAKAFLAAGIRQATTVAGLIQTPCTSQRCLAGLPGTMTLAIHLASITGATYHHLAVTSGTIEQSGIATHR